MTKSEYRYLFEIDRNSKEGSKIQVAVISARLGVSDVSVYKAMNKLRNDGYIVSEGKYAALTSKGKQLLDDYKILISYIKSELVDRCGITAETANIEATEIVCVLSEETKENILRLL